MGGAGEVSGGHSPVTWSAAVVVWQRGSCSERRGGSGRGALARTGSRKNFEETKVINIQ